MIRISQVKIPIKKLVIKKEDENSLLKDAISKQYHIGQQRIQTIAIVKKSIDARKKQEIVYTYTVDVSIKSEEQFYEKYKKGNVSLAKSIQYNFIPTGGNKLETPPIIIGTGPAGLFCGLMLARQGYKPILLERGKDVESRKEEVQHFWKTNQLDVNCNVQFGEGGAGTFSDGKLNTLVKDTTGRNGKVLQTFVEHGASQEILYQNKPHIGTDQLCSIVSSIRNEIISLGGQVRFDSQVTDIIIENQRVIAVEIRNLQNSKIERLPCQAAVLAIGHSARDTFSVLKEKGLYMEAKSFAIGVRMEHLQDMIGESQYGKAYRMLPSAEYKLTHQASNGRSVYSFCMCPGGFVVNAASEEGHLVVNGMSNQNRDEKNANSAIIVSVTPDDFPSKDVLAGIEFQRKWEKLAYQIGTGLVPVQLFKDFKENQTSNALGAVYPNIKGKFMFGNLRNCLPEYVCEALLEGIHAFGKKIKGFDREDSVLSGVETRTSSPVRIVRDSVSLESNIAGVYPCGEGAGYAGGITSAAMDGIKVYEAIAKQYKSFNIYMKL